MLLRSVEPTEFEQESRTGPAGSTARPRFQPKLVVPRTEEQAQGTLVITVQVCPPTVHQRWYREGQEPLRHGVRASLHFFDLSVSISGPKDHQNVVEYYLPQDTLNQYTDGQGLGRVNVETAPRTYLCEVFLRLTQLLLPSAHAPHLCSALFLHHFGAMLCAHVVHLHRDGVPESPRSRGGLSAWQKRLVTEILARNRYQNTKLATLAKECHLSVSHFARSFKMTFGQPFHQWLVDQRVEKSKEFLLHSDSPLVEVAFKAGFSDQATFNRTFAKVVGSSPGRWRRANRDSAPGRLVCASRDTRTQLAMQRLSALL